MRTEEQVRDFYAQYVYRYGRAVVERNEAADQYLGAAFASGRILGRTMKQINRDLKRATKVAERNSQ